MPLTFAHPAAVLPLARLRLPLSGLVVGSMAPDLVYFLRLAPRGHFGHTLPGLFLFCLPVGLALLAALWAVRGPLVGLTPDAARRRLAGVVSASPFAKPVLLVVAVLLGAVTHDVWDAFTHAGGSGVIAIPALGQTAWGGVSVFKLLQHGSTLLGLGVLASALVGWWRRAPVADVSPGLPIQARLIRVGLILGCGVVAGVGWGVFHAVGAVRPVAAFAGHAVVATTSATVLAALAYGAWARLQPEAGA